MVKGSIYKMLTRWAKKKFDTIEFNTRVFAVSLTDINKALRRKTKGDPRELLPKHFHKTLPLFDAQKAKELPPHRPGIDHTIEIEEGKSIPWGPLYNISRDELLVLRKTLTE